MAEFPAGLPSTRQLQNFIKDTQNVEVKLITNDLLEGKVRWQDQECLCIIDNSDRPTIIWRQAIVYVKPKL